MAGHLFYDAAGSAPTTGREEVSKWTYSRGQKGYKRELPPEVRFNSEPDDSELGDIAEACAGDDHYNHDGWEGDKDEREIHLFRDGVLHSSYTVTVEYSPSFSAERAASQAQGEAKP